MSSDLLGDPEYRKVAKFLNLIGRMTTYVNLGKTRDPENKNYRFQMHHRLVVPTPQVENVKYSLIQC